ncbi:MAG: YqgE/AlgH family protein [Gemmatimonas sp.]
MIMPTIDTGYLTGQLLVAMPQMGDPRFERSVIYLCAHTAEGAMGLVVNRALEDVRLPDLLRQLGIPDMGHSEAIRVHFGGPVETGQGFILHSSDYVQDSTLMVGGSVGLTATLDILKDIARGAGPHRSLLALGYSGWGAGQLESEIQANGWLTVPADEALLFDHDLDTKWERALAKIGVDVRLLASGAAGHA